LYLVPTAWDAGEASCKAFQRVSADAGHINNGWPEAWHIHPVRSVGAVRPWARR